MSCNEDRFKTDGDSISVIDPEEWNDDDETDDEPHPFLIPEDRD